MKIFFRIIMSFLLVMITLNLMSEKALAVAMPEPTPNKVDYFLPYPGILPDHLLYPIKMLRDRIMEFLTTDPLKKAELFILTADKRLGAGKILIEGGKAELGETTLSKGEKYLEQAVRKTEEAQKGKKDTAGLLEKLEKATGKHIEVLQEVLLKAPEQAKPGITNALENAQKGYQKVLEMKAAK